MKLLFPYILFACFVLALYLSILHYIDARVKHAENRLFSLLCLFSAVWSFGFWGVIIQTEPANAYFFRAIGMVGVFTYLLLAQLLIIQIGQFKKSYYARIAPVALIGYIILFFIIQKDQVTYSLSEIGMTYRFKPGFWNSAYTVYCVIISINILATILYILLYSRRKRMRTLAKKLLAVELIVLIGMIFDTILPLFGLPALPGSTIGQFIGLIAMHHAIRFVNRFQITIDNMSRYVYYSLTTPVLVYDSDYNLQIINDAALDFIGLDKAKLKAGSISSIFSVDNEEAFFFSGNRKDIDTLCLHNELHCNLSISKIHDDYHDIIGYIIIVTDLSERMESIARLEEAIDTAKNANQAKTTFLANMSHEIRTPMNAIIGFTELVLREDINKNVREYVNGIHLSSHNLLAIINDILDITKIESGKMEIIPSNYYFADLLDDVSLIISQQARKKGLAFVMKKDDHIPSQLFGDKVRIRGVLINILNNAVKYTKEGTVTFETTILSQTDDSVKLAFIVSDTGIGIRPEDQAKLFQSFERLDKKIHHGVEGSGLGLSIAHGYVTLMGGKINVRSEYGVGSVFEIIIDQKVIDATPMQHQFTIDRTNDELPTSGKITIHDTHVLLVDDNQINLIVSKALLNSYGLTVDTANDGAAAVTACRNTHYSIVFMDQMMPGMDGIEAMKQIRELDSYYASGGESKIIVLTADAIRGSREHLLAEGFDEYLGKPMNLKQLERLLKLYLPSDKIEISSYVPKDDETKTASVSEHEINYLKETLTGMDVSLGLKNCGGNLENYLNVLKINYTYGNKHLEELRDMLSQKDYQNYTIKIHSMKSTTLSIGAVITSNMAREQEKAGRDGDYDYIEQNFEPFQKEYEAQLRKIEEVLRHFHLLPETSPEDAVPPLDERIISNILINIRNHVDNFDFAKVFDILEEMQKYNLPAEYREIFDQLGPLMDELAVDSIRQLIDNTLKDKE